MINQQLVQTLHQLLPQEFVIDHIGSFLKSIDCDRWCIVSRLSREFIQEREWPVGGPQSESGHKVTYL